MSTRNGSLRRSAIKCESKKAYDDSKCGDPLTQVPMGKWECANDRKKISIFAAPVTQLPIFSRHPPPLGAWLKYGYNRSVAAKLAAQFAPALRCISYIHTRCATQESLLLNHNQDLVDAKTCWLTGYCDKTQLVNVF